MTNFKNYPVITALITPFTEQGQIDFDSLKKLVHLQEDANNAILILGSTGEGLALSLSDKKQIVNYVFGLNPKVPVVVGVGGFQLQEQIDWIQYCQNHYKVAGFLLVTPLYAKPGIKGQVAWFKALMDASKVPCIPYNIPGRSAVKMHPPVLAELVKHANFLGLKEASGNFTDFSEYQALMPHHLLYSGNDELLAEQIQRGAFGVISVASNIWPKQAHAYLVLCKTGQNTTALNQLWEEASNALFLASNPIPLKVLSYHEGIIAHPDLLPPLSHEDLSEAQTQKLLDLSQQVKACKELNV